MNIHAFLGSLPRNVIIVILVFFWLSFVFRLIVLIITILSIALAFRLSNKLRNNVIYITTPESSQKTYVPPSYAESQVHFFIIIFVLIITIMKKTEFIERSLIYRL